MSAQPPVASSSASAAEAPPPPPPPSPPRASSAEVTPPPPPASTPPPSDGGVFLLDFVNEVMSWERGPYYRIQNAAFFKEAISVRTGKPSEGLPYVHNQRLAWIGDKITRTKCSIQWYHDKDATMAEFKEKYEERAGSNAYLAMIADKQRVTEAMRRIGGGNGEFDEQEKADVIEALVAAVDVDSKGASTDAVLRAFGIFYPRYAWEDAETEGMKSESQRLDMDKRAKKVSNFWRRG